ncbi:hypothetical protein [Chondromyces apiculatus]|uniref:Uncharacterized protein n=1 Tax=Chondromyces apiculatus DSM 436 TaxID=1192034 RepID=A0A017SVX0_9BACT|nr:hypothetical protein [Chondromyces apiculatus]EYF01089.1 Hypothetical protein CAP_8647 [Chondromyces apiculatus DSM 436]
MAILWVNGLARAESPGAQAPAVDVTPKADAAEMTKTGVEEPLRNYVNLGLGGSTASRGLVLCAEVAPLAVLAFAACGSGAGVLNDQARPEIAHFRASLAPFSWEVSSLWLQPRLHAGFAEMQVGEDAAGFDLRARERPGWPRRAFTRRGLASPPPAEQSSSGPPTPRSTRGLQSVLPLRA